jgi:hypothetical protein
MTSPKRLGDEWWRPIPPGISKDALHILAARAVRAFADGLVSVLLPIYLAELGFSVFAIGARARSADASVTIVGRC